MQKIEEKITYISFDNYSGRQRKNILMGEQETKNRSEENLTRI